MAAHWRWQRGDGSATGRCGGNSTETVMNGDGQCNDNATARVAMEGATATRRQWNVTMVTMDGATAMAMATATATAMATATATVGGEECGILGRYHRGSGVAINLTLFLYAYYIVLLTPHICDAQTKRRDDRPWCGDDVDALGLGAARIWAMLGAISAPHHGRPIFWAN